MPLLIFDLDGTLIDSKQDLVQAVNAARRRMHLAPLDNDTVASYVGNGAPVLIRRAMGPQATEEQCREALEYFYEFYREHMLDHTRLYPGVREALDQLHAAGMPMAVLTNKPVRFSRGIIEGLGVAGHFFQVYGGNSFEQKKPHPVGVETLMSEAHAGRAETLMIGDSAVDIQTARNAGVRAVGVTWGLQPESLEQVPPDHVIRDMRELVPLVKNGSR
ncbi:MAG TPA: HAD family hydrolase [Bryobacteraceae bacterium]|nr:HAD family hydrolase [Bryobacteraceae bacterium]